ncbi:MAG: hypothetical protein HHJ10_08950 [Cellulomonas sp.]|uniref:hypothetical protein n=1 Tax=Cellulomonas sp. TaxID=40001 RepID=UPI00178E3EA4|nr:hypothetical protein [Cellulomonas sp.]NMM31151.1 hypothetical protein [Cellulomonas sp.]
MTPGLRSINRTATLIVGIILLVVGGAMIAWWNDDLRTVWAGAPDSLEPGRVSDVMTTSWWTAVAAAGGIALIVLGLFWLRSHLRSADVSRAVLPGLDPSGQLTLELSGVARHFATLAKRQDGVSEAKAKFVTERGRTILTSTVTVDPEADVAAVSAAIGALTAQARDMAGIERFAARTHLHISRRARAFERVS